VAAELAKRAKLEECPGAKIRPRIREELIVAFNATEGFDWDGAEWNDAPTPAQES